MPFIVVGPVTPTIIPTTPTMVPGKCTCNNMTVKVLTSVYSG